MLTCSGSECEGCTASVPLKCVNVDLVGSAWFQTCMYNRVSKTSCILYIVVFTVFIFVFTCNSIWTWVGFNGSLNGYVACGWGCGRGFNQEARDSFCLGAPGQSDGGIIHVGNAHTARWANILKLRKNLRVRKQLFFFFDHDHSVYS